MVDQEKQGMRRFIEVNGKVLPAIAMQDDLRFESIIPQYEELVDAMANGVPDSQIATKIRMLRDKRFDFDNLEANLPDPNPGPIPGASVM